jgi:hypothetical protein
MHPLIRIVLFISSLVLVSSGGTALGQQASASLATPNPAPTPIPLIEVASHAQSAMESIRDIEASLSADHVSTTVARGLPRLTKEIDSRRAENSKLLAASLPLDLLHRLELVLQAFRDQLSAWNRDLTEQAKTLDLQIAHLDQLKEVWQSTLRLLELSQTPPGILRRVQSLLDSIGRTREAVESRREAVLTLLSRVLESTDRVQTASSSVEQAQANAVKNLFVPDSPPIWSREIGNWTEESHESLFWRESVRAFSAYIKGRPTILLLHAIIILLLAFVVHWLGRVPAPTSLLSATARPEDLSIRGAFNTLSTG